MTNVISGIFTMKCCAKCGEKAALVTRRTNDSFIANVECTEMWCSERTGDYDDWYEAVRAWNERRTHDGYEPEIPEV